MSGWYFQARRAQQGTRVELIVHAGLREANPMPIGHISFDRVQWESFRPIIIGGMRVAGHMRIPIDFMDETRGNPDRESIRH